MDFEELQKQTQQGLIDFLRTDLELAQTFVDLAAERRRRDDQAGYERLLLKAIRAAETVRQFEEKISHPEAKEQIQQGLERLQRCLSHGH